TLFNLPPAVVEETRCQVPLAKYGRRAWPDRPPQGCEGCFYHVRWLPKKLPLLKRLFFRSADHDRAIEDLVQANQLIQAKYDEAKHLATDLELTNRKLIESKQALETQRAELIESEKKYRHLFENGSDLLCVHDLEGNLIETNLPFKKEYGWRREDIEGLNLRDLIPERHRLEFDAYLANIISNGSDDGYLKTMTRSGEEIVLEYRNKLIVDNDGHPRAVQGAARDVTQRIKFEEEKKALEIKLQNARKLESLGTLAGGVAHDLNNILSGIVSYPDLLLMDLEAESPLRKPLLTIKKSGEKAADMVQDLLTLARRSVATKKIINLNRVIGDFIDSLEYSKIIDGRGGLHVETRLSENVSTIAGSETHIFKTVMNLVANAVDAMPTGGTITIATRDCRLDESHVGFEIIPEGEYTLLEIADRGIGMPSSDLDKIFEPFYTKKVMGRSGSGLGMSVVWGTIKDHGGFIDIISKEGSGSTFVLYFPVSRSEKEAPRSVYIEDYLGQGESILVVDDAPEQRDLAKRMMQRLGYDVHTAASGEAALALVKRRHFDVIILDMIMPPGMNGLETYREILAVVPRQKAVIASGYSETEDVRETLRLGAGCYLKKPYTLENIGLALKSELNRPSTG
ncbi:MAG: PAS domain S-box protein, partial [Desulfosarcina sp.]